MLHRISTKPVSLNLSKRVKGYNQIKESYFGKTVKATKQVLSKGIIISLSGFSDEVITSARKDGILLVGPEEIKSVLASSSLLEV